MRRCGAIDSVAELMYERSGSRFSVSGVGTQTMTSSQPATSDQSAVARRSPCVVEHPERGRRDVLDVRVPGVDAVDATRVGLDAEHGMAGLCERNGKGEADVAGTDDSNVFIHEFSA